MNAGAPARDPGGPAAAGVPGRADLDAGRRADRDVVGGADRDVVGGADVDVAGLRPDAAWWDAPIARALAGEGVRAVYQPIVDLPGLTVAGYEALARFDLEAALTPDRWFAAAAARGVVAELEAVSLRTALRGRATLPSGTFLTINLEPESLFAAPVSEVLAEQGDLHGLVVEVTEHRPLGDVGAVGARLDELRAAGARIAVDDAGAGHSGLQQILTLRPSILKLDRSLVEGVDRDEAKAALVEMVGLFARRVDSWLLAEGIETEAEARRLLELGVPLAQGYLFGRPAAPWAGIDEAVAGRLAQHRRSSVVRPLLALVEPVPAAPLFELAAARHDVLCGRHAIVVLVDEDGRALGALDADAAIRGELRQPMRASTATPPADLAKRIVARTPLDTATPVLATDDDGLLVGQITIARLLGVLGRRST